MTISIDVKVEDQPLRDALAQLRRRLDDLTPAMSVIGRIVRASVVRNFEAGGRPRWPVSVRARREGGMTLINSARLMRSVTAQASRDSVAVGTNVAYAAIHQFGGRTGPRVIEPKKKKALRTPYGIFRRVRHPGSKIPARPFLAVQTEDWTEIAAAVNDYLTGR
jgi:phage virion morphogenesis protein